MASTHRAAFFLCLAAFAQQQQAPPATPPPAQQSTQQSTQPIPLQTPTQTPQQPEKTVNEMATHEEQATFKSRVDLVMVPVVVRDGHGKPVAGLKKEDFLLFDKGKPQNISRFTMEKAGGQNIKFAEDADSASKPSNKDAEAVIPQRFIAYLFDDIHVKFGDLAFTRQAAIKHLSQSLSPTDRAGIFTTSGQTNVDFTDDKAKLIDALNKIVPRPIGRSSVGQDCPDVSYYMADQIVNKNNSEALGAATSDTMICMHLDASMRSTAQTLAQSAAQNMMGIGDHESQVAYSVLKDVVRRMSATPGQRIIVLASPGFLTTDNLRFDEQDIMDRAVRTNITINGLDMRGLYTNGPDASVARTSRLKQEYDRESALAEGETIGEIAYGTGGTFFQNNNSMEEGFRATAAAPETFYLLGFSPQNLKLDGSFHSLKVNLKSSHLEVQARKGYYAPKHLTDAAENAKREIEEALFSREELKELPVDLHAQFFKAANGSVTITVLAHLDVKQFKFKKANERNNNTVTVVSSIFDRNGTIVSAITKTLELHLKDETLEKKIDSGLTIRTPFNLKPGTYLVRLVVRDAEGQAISAENGAVTAQ